MLDAAGALADLLCVQPQSDWPGHPAEDRESRQQLVSWKHHLLMSTGGPLPQYHTLLQRDTAAAATLGPSAVAADAAAPA